MVTKSLSIAKSDMTRFGGTTARVGNEISSGSKSIPAYSSILILNFLSVSIFNFADIGKFIVMESHRPELVSLQRYQLSAREY